jgi:hypothetical protein
MRQRKPQYSPEPLAVSPRVGFGMIQVGNTKGYDLIARGELDSFIDGHQRRITVESIKAYIARRLAETAGQSSRRIQNTKPTATNA